MIYVPLTRKILLRHYLKPRYNLLIQNGIDKKCAEYLQEFLIFIMISTRDTRVLKETYDDQLTN